MQRKKKVVKTIKKKIVKNKKVFYGKNSVFCTSQLSIEL